MTIRTSPALHGPSSRNSLVVEHATVIDVEAGRSLPDHSVAVEGDRITAVGPAVPVPPGAEVIDAAGRALVPGLWDMHVHTFDAAVLPTFLANGITGIRHLGAAPVHWRWRDQLRAGELIAPRMVFASPIIDGPRPTRPGSIAVRTPDDARRAVADSIALGAEFLKVYSQVPRAAYAALVEQARIEGIDVAGHVPFEVGVRAAVQRSIEHLDGVSLATSSEEDELAAAMADLDGDPTQVHQRWSRTTHRAAVTHDPERAAALHELFLANGTWHVPTLSVKQAMALMGTAEFPLATYVESIEPGLRGNWARAAAWMREPDAVDREVEVFEHALALVGGLHRAGVPLLAGTDTFVPGQSLHDELALLVRAGLSPLDALRAATVRPAEFLGVRDRFGTVAAGRTADLLLLDGDPLVDITRTRRIHAVLLGGRRIR